MELFGNYHTLLCLELFLSGDTSVLTHLSTQLVTHAYEPPGKVSTHAHT